MIIIHTPKVFTADGRTRLCADIEVDGIINPLWVEVEDKYERYLCFERGDAFVLGVLHWAMKNGHDIRSEAPVTDRLYEQLTLQFLPAFGCANNLKFIPQIMADTAPEMEHPEGGCAVGTGCSCGVDSLHVYAMNYGITHGCVWNVHGVTCDETPEKRERGWKNLVKQAREFTAAVGVELIVGDSNFDRGCITSMAFDGSTSYGNLFFVFALQKLWKTYYIASGYAADDYDLGRGLHDDPAHYELFLFSLCSLGKLTVRVDGVDKRRVDKVEDLIKYEPSYRFLNVCWDIREDGRNCTYGCAKCMRTLLDLEALDAVDQYSNVFDTEYYHTHKHEYLAEYYRGLLQHNPYALELKPYFRTKSFRVGDKMGGAWIVLKKIVKKLLRGGKTRVGKFSSKG